MGRRELRREAPPARGCSARMSPPSPSPALPTSEHRAPPPFIPLSPHPSSRTRLPPARLPRLTARGEPRGGSARRPGLRAKLLRAAGGRRAAPPARAHQEQPGKFGRPLPSVKGHPPEPPTCVRNRTAARRALPRSPPPAGGDTRPRMRTRAAPQPGP